MPSLANIIGNIAETLQFSVTGNSISCCNAHSNFASARMLKSDSKKMNLDFEESVLVMGNRIYKFNKIDDLHAFLHNKTPSDKPQKCKDGVYIHEKNVE
jgi:hypothetical protein